MGEASQQAELLALGRQSARPSPPAEYDARVGFSEPLRILAFKPALGGEPGTAALRVKEHEGRAKTVRCRVAGAVRHAACDLLERGGEWRDGDTFDIDLPAFGMATYKLQFGGPEAGSSAERER